MWTTDCVLSGMGHLSPVVSVEPVLATAETSLKSLITADIEGNKSHMRLTFSMNESI